MVELSSRKKIFVVSAKAETHLLSDPQPQGEEVASRRRGDDGMGQMDGGF